MVDNSIDLFAHCPDSLDSIDIYVFQKFVNFIMFGSLLNQHSQEFNEVLISIIDTEE